MFPPEKTSDVGTVIQNLWGSLHRASNHLGTKSLVRPYSTGRKYYVAINLNEEIASKCLDPMKDYMRAYAKESGWTMSRFRVHRRHVDFELSLASRER